MQLLKKYRIYIGFGAVALSLFLVAARDSFIEDLANDSCTAYYVNFARNLTRYPVSATKLMSAQLVGQPPQHLYTGETEADFYRDHPPMTVWATALSLKVKSWIAPHASDIIAGRMVSIVSSIAILLFTIFFSITAFGNHAGTLAGLAVLSCPVFFSHGLVINFEPICCALMLLGFFEWRPWWFIPAHLTDWPAFFATPVVTFFEYKKNKKFDAALYMMIAVASGLAVLFFIGYLTNSKGFVAQFVGGTGEKFASRSVEGSWPLLTTLKLIIKPMITRNFGIFNLIILGISLYGWLKNLLTLNRTQQIGLALVVTTFFNVLLFHAWAIEHSFWTYYLMPAIGIAVAEQFTKHSGKKRTLLVACLVGSLLFSSYHYAVKLLRFNTHPSFVELCPMMTKPLPHKLLTDSNTSQVGHGYAPRWYHDQSLTIVSPTDPLIKTECATQNCLWITDKEAPTPKEWAVQNSCHYANITILTFSFRP